MNEGRGRIRFFSNQRPTQGTPPMTPLTLAWLAIRHSPRYLLAVSLYALIGVLVWAAS